MKKNYTDTIKSLMKEIEEEILSTENWIYYFWSISEIQEYLVDNLNDWKEDCDLKVIELCNNYVRVDIETPEEVLHYRILYFDTFESQIEDNISKNAKDIISNKLRDKKESREYYSEVVKRLDDEISDLEKKLKEE